MPQISRTVNDHAFKNIKMYDKKERTIQEELNNITRSQKNTKFVDRSEHNKMGKDAFFKLLTYQLKNQDPLKPVDQKKFAAELAQFSQLEQLSNMNNQLKNLGKNSMEERKFYGASFLGKKITTRSTSIPHDGISNKIEIPFVLSQDAREVVLRIFDSKNQLAQQITLNDLEKGSQKFMWNGKNSDGSLGVKDIYHFDIKALNHKLEPFKGEVRFTGIVTGISFKDSEVLLEVDRKKTIFLRDVSALSMPKEKQGRISSYKQFTKEE